MPMGGYAISLFLNEDNFFFLSAAVVLKAMGANVAICYNTKFS